MSRRSESQILFPLLFLVITLVECASFHVRKRCISMSLEEDPSITFVVVPRQVVDISRRNMYLLTYGSYLLTSPLSKILVLMPRNMFDPVGLFMPVFTSRFNEDRMIFDNYTETDEDNVPYIDEWFITGLDWSDSDMVCWINSDIILPSKWYSRVKFTLGSFRKKGKQTVIISRRCDINLSLTSPSVEKWPLNFDLLAKNSKPYSIFGVDFYLISRRPMTVNFDDIPPYKMGRFYWDPWLTSWLDEEIGLTTLGEFCTLHIDHPPNKRKEGDVKASENFEMRERTHRRISHSNEVRYTLLSRGPISNWSVVQTKKLSK